MTTTTTSVNTKGLFGVSLPRMKKTYWEGLDEPTKESCVGPVLPQSYNGKAAWEPAGCLSKRWEDEFHTSVKSAHNDNKQHVYIKKDKHAAVTVSFRLYLLGPADQPAASKPFVVVSSDNPRITTRTVGVLKKHKEIEKLGFDFVAQRNKIKILTGTPGLGSASYFHNATLMTTCGLRIVSAPVPVHRESEAKRSTLGGVLLLGGYYYGLTVAHTFLHDFGGNDSGYSSSDNASSASEDSTDEGNVADEESALQPLAVTYSPTISAVYLDNQKHPNTDSTSLIRDSLYSRETASSVSLIGHTEVTSQNAQRTESSPNSRWFCLDSDWALVEIQDSRFMLPNTFVANGKERTVRSFCTKDNHPEGGLVVLRGNKEIVHAAAPRNLAGISLPWSRDFVDVWIMEFQSTRGDCGTWVVDARSGSLFGVVVASSADSDFTYVLPAEDIINSIFAKWKDHITSSHDMFPSVAASADNDPIFEIQRHRDFSNSDSNRFITDLYLPDHGPTVIQSATESQLSGLLERFADLESGDYRGCYAFAKRHPEIWRCDRNLLLQDAFHALKASKESHARRCVQRAVMIRDCASLPSSKIKNYFDDLIHEEPILLKEFLKDCQDANANLKARVLPSLTSTAERPLQQEADHVTALRSMSIEGRTPWQAVDARFNDRNPAPISRTHQITTNSVPFGARYQNTSGHGIVDQYSESTARLPQAAPNLANFASGYLQSPEVHRFAGPTSRPTARTHTDSPTGHALVAARGRLPSPATTISDSSSRTLDEPDARYRVIPPSVVFFTIGRVFATPCHTAVDANRVEAIQKWVVKDCFGESILTHIQRMVVVKKGHRFSWCVPITTYQGKGVAKRGLSDEDRRAHAVIYMEGTNVRPTDAERGMMDKKSIAVHAAGSDQKLDPMSRINFGKVHTIEHNVKVMNVGRISEDDFEEFKDYWNLHR